MKGKFTPCRKGFLRIMLIPCLLILLVLVFVQIPSVSAALGRTFSSAAPGRTFSQATFPTPPPGQPGTSNPSGSSPNNGVPAWAVAGPSFAGKTLHWTQENYSYIANGIDPANGQTVKADIWVQFDANGEPSRFQGRYTLVDGTFVQEILQTPTEVSVVFGPQYAKLTIPNSTSAQCTVQQSSLTADALNRMLPIFADRSKLPGQGFAKSPGAAIPQFPTTSSLMKASPQDTFAATQVQQWTRLELTSNGAHNTVVLGIDARNRVVLEHAQLTDAQGHVLNENRIVRGTLFVYSPSVVPASTFVTLDQVLGGCHA